MVIKKPQERQQTILKSYLSSISPDLKVVLDMVKSQEQLKVTCSQNAKRIAVIEISDFFHYVFLLQIAISVLPLLLTLSRAKQVVLGIFSLSSVKLLCNISLKLFIYFQQLSKQISFNTSLPKTLNVAGAQLSYTIQKFQLVGKQNNVKQNPATIKYILYFHRIIFFTLLASISCSRFSLAFEECLVCIQYKQITQN